MTGAPTPLPNTDCEQLAKALERVPLDAREVTLCLWNVVVAAVEQLTKKEVP